MLMLRHSDKGGRDALRRNFRGEIPYREPQEFDHGCLINSRGTAPYLGKARSAGPDTGTLDRHCVV